MQGQKALGFQQKYLLNFKKYFIMELNECLTGLERHKVEYLTVLFLCELSL